MLKVPPAERGALRGLRQLFLPERPGPLAGLHAVGGRCGTLWVDRAPAPRVAVARAGIDHQLAGDASALTPAMLRAVGIAGTVDAPPPLAALLREAHPDLDVWDRVIHEIRAARAVPVPPGFTVRRLGAADAPSLDALEPDLRWISAPYDSHAGLAATGRAFGAFADDGRLACVTAPFHVGERYEDVGIVTRPFARRRGVGAACAARVVADVLSRGRTASWSTTPDNAGSLATARRLGAERVRDDVLYLVRWPGDG